MNKLPEQYQWLLKEGSPKMLAEALKLYGTKEDLSVKSNPTILAWAAEVGGKVADVYKADSIPWCALFVSVVAKRAGKALPKDPLWALNWGTFGNHVDIPMLGDVLVFVRKAQDGTRAGHTGIYVFETSSAYGVLGGNQSDCVCITLIPKKRLYAARRPIYSIATPANVRRVFLSSKGVLSTKED